MHSESNSYVVIVILEGLHPLVKDSGSIRSTFSILMRSSKG